MVAPGSHTAARGRVEALDLLRLIAVLAVIFYHYGFRGAAADGYTNVSLPELEWVVKYGYLGVQMFFVISGFVIAYSAEGRTGTSFAIARVARIYPGFLFCMTLTFLAMLALGGPNLKATTTQWFANTLIVAPALKQPFMDGAYWSIVYEIVFYGWVCLFIMLGLFRRRIHLIILLWLAISLLNELVLGSGILRKLILTDESGFFAAGLLLYEMYVGRRGIAVRVLFVTAVVCAVAQALINVQWIREHYAKPFDDLVVASLCIASIGAVALAVRVRQMPLPSSVVLAVGGLTYPLYLLHQHIGYIIFNHVGGFASPAVLVVATAMLMIACSWMTWRYVDRPGQRLVKTALTHVARSVGIQEESHPTPKAAAISIPAPAISANPAPPRRAA